MDAVLRLLRIWSNSVMAKKTTTDDIKESLTARAAKPRKITHKDLLSTGITVLNLAMANTTTGGIPKGTIAHYVGDSDSGKTVVALSVLAEAARNEAFKDYRLIFWNAEDGALMDHDAFYGKKVSARLEQETPELLEEWYYSVDDAVAVAEKEGRPFVGVLDSMDALYPKAWAKKFAQQKSAARKDAEASGDYGMAKAKINSENLRRLRSKLRKTGSILIIISQTRDNANAGYGDKKSVSGGRTLKFYSSIQLWTSTRQTLKKTVLGQPRPHGIQMQIDVKKNHVTGKKSRIFACILNDHGVDDVGTNVDYLISEGYWKTTGKEGKGTIVAAPFSEEKLTREKLIRLIEAGDHERELRQLVRKVWFNIEDGLKSNRKARYE